MGFVKWMEKNPRWLKAVLCIPFVSAIWVVYRLIRSIRAKNVIGIVVAILLFFVFWGLWILDLITCLVLNRVLWFD